MRSAIISDIHANLPALEAVLRRIDDEGIENILCLGDIVGYGAEPAACLQLIRERCTYVVRGNHDQAVAVEEGMRYLPREGRAAAKAHRAALNEDDRAWLAALPLVQTFDGITLVHATPFEPSRWHRIGGYHSAMLQFEHFETEVCFVGHTHVPGMMADAIGVFRMRRGHRYMINAGSVGQPRDGDTRAAFCVFDDETFAFDVIRVEYDIDKAARLIVEAGLPSSLADRLKHGA